MVFQSFLVNEGQTLLIIISLIIIIAAFLAFLTRILKQPPILAYILTGILLGPFLLNIIKPSEVIDSLSSIGVAFLLFIIGLSLNINILREVGKISLITGAGQVLFTSLIGFFLIKVLGFSTLSAIYISIALSFSSTIIIVKLLTDKGVIDSLYGRISVGFLLVQDFIAIIALILISGTVNDIGSQNALFYVISKTIFMALFIYFISKFIITRLFSYFAKTQELLFIGSIAWCFILVLLSQALGFSVEIGAFLAGISLASLPYTFDIISKITSLRDFFIVLFFVNLGLQFSSFVNISGLLFSAIILSLFVLIGNPIIVMILMGLFGYKKNIGFYTGLTVAQISEFSLILVGLGYSIGHLGLSDVTLVTLVGIITISLSTYMILYSEKIYIKLEKYLNIFERKKVNKYKNGKFGKNKKYDIIILGGHRLARFLIESFRKSKWKILVIDYNPDIIKILNKKKVDVFYGDISSVDVLNDLPFRYAKIVVSTIPNQEDNSIVISYLREFYPDVKLFLTTNHMHEALELYKKDVDYVILPYLISSQNVAEILKKALKSNEYINTLKKEQINLIKDSNIASYQLSK